MIIKNFYNDVLADYERNLDIFFDADSGAVFEAGREDGTPKFLFTEVTGYAILDDLTLYSISGNKHYLDKASKSARWIAEQAQDPCGGVLTRHYFDRDAEADLSDKSFKGRRIYSFDTAICLRGIVALYQSLGEVSLLNCAVRMGDFLVDRVISPEGEVCAIYDAQQGEAVPPERGNWSRCFGAFHSKVAEALIDLYEATHNEKYSIAARAICTKVLKFQSEKGNFETSSGRTELHPHCYATEGLLHVGRQTQDASLIAAALRATEWALSYCENGEIPQVIDYAEGAPLARFRTDSLAQVLALASDLMQMGHLDPANVALMDQLCTKLLQMKKDGDGYYQYGFYEREFKGKMESDTRSYWTNMFCLRGLIKYYTASLLKDAYVAVLAGGIGSRVWPISCENRPKPVSYSLLGERSLLQETIRRFTHGYFFNPERIFILCSANAMQQVVDQAGLEGVPSSNCVIEKEPKGTVPAVGLALDGLPQGKDRQNRLVIISMADNVITPHQKFQDALRAGIITARENDCIVSIGKPADKNADLDVRFGHHMFSQQIHSYRTHEVEQFVEKPAVADFERIKAAPGHLAWECGTVLFKEAYYKTLVPASPKSGNLAEDLLSSAVAWETSGQDNVRLAVALLDSDTRFEDFGVPGVSVKQFYKGDPRFDRGNGNICIGSPEKTRLLSCEGNLVISDELPIKIYGLRNHLIIDNAITNTAVVMPLEEVSHLPNLYRLFSGSKRYEPFVVGGQKALVADPTMFVEKSPNTHANSEFGLVFAYKIKERLAIHRDQNGLHIINETYPALDERDFTVLLNKQSSDPNLAQHLVDVGALAKCLSTGRVMVSGTAKELLNKLCLYHAIGGQLTDEGERKELEMIKEFRLASKLDRRFLDSRIIYEIIGMYGKGYQQSAELSVGLLGDNVNSALEFLKADVVKNSDLRDILIALIQVQDNPHSFAAFRKDLDSLGFGALKDEIVKVFSCFKIAKNIAIGRWLWRRKKLRSKDTARGIFLKFDRGDLEDLAFILSFSSKWLKNAEIAPGIFLDEVNNLLAEEDQAFIDILGRLQDGYHPLLSDRIYLQLLNKNAAENVGGISEILSESLALVKANKDQAFQYTQLLELPQLLNDIAGSCTTLTQGTASAVKDLIVDFYHKNWRTIKPHVSSQLINQLIS